MVRNRVLDFCVSKEERDLYCFLCTTKRESGPLMVKVSYLRRFELGYLDDLVYCNLLQGDLYDELKSELRWLTFECHQWRRPKLDKGRVARMMVLLWRLLELERTTVAEEFELSGVVEHQVTHDVLQVRVYILNILERIRMDGNLE